VHGGGNCEHEVKQSPASRWSELPGKTKHAPSRSPVLYWCQSARVTEEQLRPTEVLTHIQCE